MDSKSLKDFSDLIDLIEAGNRRQIKDYLCVGARGAARKGAWQLAEIPGLRHWLILFINADMEPLTKRLDHAWHELAASLGLTRQSSPSDDHLGIWRTLAELVMEHLNENNQPLLLLVVDADKGKPVELADLGSFLAFSHRHNWPLLSVISGDRTLVRRFGNAYPDLEMMARVVEIKA
jgi:hypothetical protein